MRSFLIHWLFTGIALAVTAHFVPGIVVTSTAALVFGALVLGLVNAIVRPVLVVLTLPITVLTIGFFYLVVNGVAGRSGIVRSSSSSLTTLGRCPRAR